MAKLIYAAITRSTAASRTGSRGFAPDEGGATSSAQQ
jgi:hypothetical protein